MSLICNTHCYLLHTNTRAWVWCLWWILLHLSDVTSLAILTSCSCCVSDIYADYHLQTWKPDWQSITQCMCERETRATSPASFVRSCSFCKTNNCTVDMWTKWKCAQWWTSLNNCLWLSKAFIYALCTTLGGAPVWTSWNFLKESWIYLILAIKEHNFLEA